MAEIFVSYTHADQAWAFWIGQELEKLGHTPHIHDWELSSGANIMEWMEDRFQKSSNALLVISAAYLTKDYSKLERLAAEWAAVDLRPNFALPVFVEDCQPPLMLANIKRCNLFGVSEDQARARLAEYLAPADRPRGPIVFPVSNSPTSTSPNPAIKFPGNADAGADHAHSVSSRVSDARNESPERIEDVALAKPPAAKAARPQGRTSVESTSGLNLSDAAEIGGPPVKQPRLSLSWLRLLVFGVPLVAITGVVGLEWRGPFRNVDKTPVSSIPTLPKEPQWKLEAQGGNIANLCTEPAKIFEDHDFGSRVSGSIQPCEPLKNVADDADGITSATLNGETWLSFKALHRPAFLTRKSLCQDGLQSKC
jgi:hypothetical protein